MVTDMTNDLIVLYASAASIGFAHTILGPDHYLPFIVMSRVRSWSLRKTVVITALCGVGHVLGSVMLGLLGLALGLSVMKLTQIESMRGDVAGWLLLGFGLTYSVWGLWQAFRHHTHSHPHVHGDGAVHAHNHDHTGEHLHAHEEPGSERGSLTPWVLFTIFLFGPCELLIPVLMYPAAKGSMLHVALISLVFGVVTIGTMITVVMLAYLGAGTFRWRALQRYGHALAGLIVLGCGVAVTLGL
jgi:ABC-type nickel/cobalt efflux system permease component RcnA